MTGGHPVDRGRVYLTGISMGGYGAWALAALYPTRFAALVPICGGGLRSLGFPERVRDLVGAFDDVVSPAESRHLVRLVTASLGGRKSTLDRDASRAARGPSAHGREASAPRSTRGQRSDASAASRSATNRTMSSGTPSTLRDCRRRSMGSLA